MEKIDLHKTFLRLQNGELIEIINPKLKIKKGIIYIKGLFDKNKFREQKDIETLLNIKYGHHSVTTNDFFEIIGLDGTNSEVEISAVLYHNINYAEMKIEFISYGYMLKKIKRPSIDKIENQLLSIGLEAFKLQFNQLTTIERKRTILGKEENQITSYRKDYSEASLKFSVDKNIYELKLLFIEKDKSELVNLNIKGDNKLDFDDYQKIKFELESFFSYASGNNVIFRNESYYHDQILYQKTYSTRRTKYKYESDFIKINNIHFRQHNIFQDYLNSFNTFLLVGRHIDLSSIIFLLNQSRKVSLESGFFIMIIAIERLANEILGSPFLSSENMYYLEQNEFDMLFEETKEKFKSSFSDLKERDQTSYNNLYSKLCGINRIGKTDKKIKYLLGFAEIEETPEINSLFTILRNLAVHKGEIDFPEGKAFENYKLLNRLINEIICNIIQYKGVRYIKSEGQTNFIQKKERYIYKYDTD